MGSSAKKKREKKKDFQVCSTVRHIPSLHLADKETHVETKAESRQSSS